MGASRVTNFSMQTHMKTKRAEYGITNGKPQKLKHFNVRKGASRVTNSSISTHIKMKRAEYGFTTAKPQKFKTFQCLHRCITCHEFMNGNPPKNGKGGIRFHERETTEK